ncbi:MAG: SgcJ/EcaC family oxidoreductase [Pseudomonadota bacterium]|nr:SgcJ/EcaC family oxidoreductase [Pseudomonadota bacterium]
MPAFMSIVRLMFMSVLMLLTLWLPARADTPAPMSAAEQEVLHDELRAVKRHMQDALNHQNLDALLAHVTPDVVFTTMNGDRVIGQDAIRRYYAQMLQGPDALVESVVTAFEADALSHLLAPDVAIAYGHSQDRYRLRGGAAFEVRPLWTSTLVKRDGRWLIASFDYSVNMFDNPVLAEQRRVMMGVGAGVAVVLAALAFFIGWRRGRARQG